MAGPLGMFYTKAMHAAHYVEQRPWGSFERFTLNEPSTVKIITIKPNQALSLQQHAHRDESWRILDGSGTVEVGGTQSAVAQGQDFFVARGTKHRIAAGAEGLQVLEVAHGQFDEDDITRFDDKYGRA